MRPLKPLTIMIVAPLLVAITVAVLFSYFHHNFHDPRLIAIAAITGYSIGLLLVAPIVASEFARASFVRRHFTQFDRWSSIIGALGLGHLIGISIGNWGMLIAFVAVFLTVLFRVFLSGLATHPPMSFRRA